MCKTFYIIGTTCVGKDYFIERACERHPTLFGKVQVGKEFRRRYPPEFFEGKSAMPKTEDEAFDIFKEQWDLNKMIGKKYILVSAQPRLPSQVIRVCGYAPGTAVWLYHDDETIQRRLENRFKDDESAKELAQKRLVNDRIQMHDTLFQLIKNGHPIKTIDARETDIDTVIDQIAHFGEF